MFEIPAAIVAAAFGPAAVLLAAVARAGRAHGAGPLRCAAYFAAGGLLVAPVSAWSNDRLRDVLGLPADVVAAAAAPVVEEALKAVALGVGIWWTGSQLPLRAWIAGGMALGLGFTAMENTQYLMLSSLQGGPAGLWRGIFVRGFAWGMHHAVFAALGAVALHHAIGARREAGRAFAWALAAVSLHVAWNTVGAAAIVAMVCDAPSAASACRWPPGILELFVLTPLLSVGTLSPGLVALAVAWHRDDAGAAPPPGSPGAAVS